MLFIKFTNSYSLNYVSVYYLNKTLTANLLHSLIKPETGGDLSGTHFLDAIPKNTT